MRHKTNKTQSERGSTSLKVTKKLQAVFEKALHETQQQMLEERRPPKAGRFKTEAKCSVCESAIIEVWTYVFTDHHSHAIIGPGSRNQHSLMSTLHCSGCGLMFDKLPGTPESESEPTRDFSNDDDY